MTQRARNGDSRESRDKKAAGGKPDLTTVLGTAVQQFTQLTGKQIDGVTGARREGDDGGWSVLVDAVELERIPSTTTVLATYRVDVDSVGGLVGYERLRRYVRGAVDPA